MRAKPGYTDQEGLPRHLPAQRPGGLQQAEVEVEVGGGVLVEDPSEVAQLRGGELDHHAHPGPVLEAEGLQGRLPVLHLHVPGPDPHGRHEAELLPHVPPLQLRPVYLAALEVAGVGQVEAVLHPGDEPPGQTGDLRGDEDTAGAQLGPAQPVHLKISRPMRAQ